MSSFSVAPDGSLTFLNKVILDEQSNPKTGPALAYDSGALWLAWISPDKKVNARRGKEDLTFDPKITSDTFVEHSRLDRGPAIATAGGGTVVVASWIGRS